MLLKKIYCILCTIVFTSISALAQQTETVEMADAFRADGKIYVVITVVAIILIGLLVYLISLDKKIGKMEKEYNEQN
jgi:K+-transporting ATPase A subunit